jgi:hypothetical protein
MSHGTGGLDPRITGPASLAQLHADDVQPGIPLITDEEAERRQREADASRRRDRALRRRVAALAAVAFALAVATWLFLSLGPLQP